jgi:SNW domain-containing protein 1
MASIRSSLAASLPAPKHSDDHHQQPRSSHTGITRVIGANQLGQTLASSSAVVVRRAGPPSYRQRQHDKSWRPRLAEDYADGGAFPEIAMAQYPLEMGRPGAAKSNALAVTLDAQGKVQYDAIARLGHSDNRVIHASFKDLIPLRQRADAGEIDLSRPSAEVVAETTERTRAALATLISGAVAAQKPKNINVGRKEATFVKYTPASQMGDRAGKERIIKIVSRQLDPMEPGRWKAKKIPGGPRSPPPPVMQSPPRKLTAADQEAWRIPPAVSNWKNAKGYTVPLDKRVAANGQSLLDNTISDRHAQLAEAIKIAETQAREEVRQRAEMQQKLAEKEKAQKEAHLRSLAEEARRAAHAARGEGNNAQRQRRRSDSADSRGSRYDSDSDSDDSRRGGGRREGGGGGGRQGGRRRDDDYSDSDNDRSGSDDSEYRERQRARREQRREEERKLRQSRMGNERRLQVMAREQNRDMSEQIALGIAKPTSTREGMYDSRLFNRPAGGSTGGGLNEDDHYDKPLFEAQNALASIYRPRAQAEDEYDDEAGDKEMARIQKAGRFNEALGKGGFKGADAQEPREGPVQFQKDTGADPFNVDKFLSEVEKSGAGGGEGSAPSSGGKRGYGLQESDGRRAKRARVHDDDD